MGRQQAVAGAARHGRGRAGRPRPEAVDATGRKAQSNVLTALSDAYGGAGDGLAAVAAVRAGRAAAAKADIANERTEVGKSLPYFEASGKALGLFAG